MHLVGRKWVFRLQYNLDGTVQIYKVRLVARGFQQTPGIDYFETFNPAVKDAKISLILSLVVQFDWDVKQIDINNVFSNGDLEEQAYMLQLDGFITD